MPATETSSLRLRDLPEDVLLTLCDYIHPEALHALSLSCPYWKKFCLETVWPRRLAVKLGVRDVRLSPASSCPNTRVQPPSPAQEEAHVPDSEAWARLLHTVSTHASSRTLCISIQLSSTDSVTSLALEYAVSRQDIFRTNALFSEHHVTCRTHLYIPLLNEAAVLRFTGIPTEQHVPVLVRDNHLSNKYHLVVKFRPVPGPTPDTASALSRRESYVRQLVVKLIAKRLFVDIDEVRFYLDDNNFDVARAYKQLLSDHNFSC